MVQLDTQSANQSQQGPPRVSTSLLIDEPQLFKQFQDNESYRSRLTGTMTGMTYEEKRATEMFPVNTVLKR